MTTTVTALQNVVDDDAETIVIAGDRGRGPARPFGAADLAEGVCGALDTVVDALEGIDLPAGVRP